MILQRPVFWFFLLSFAFVGLHLYLTYNGVPFAAFLPIGLLVAYTALFRLDWVYWMVVAFTPLSVNINEFGIMDLGLFLPTEPLLFGILILFSGKMLIDGGYDLRLLKHPVSIIILVQLIWMFITAITSEDILVSAKYLLARTWFVVPGYFFAMLLLKRTSDVRFMLWLSLVPLCIVVMYTLVNHALHGFEEKPAHWVMSPFYKDHTSYGAILAMYIPPAIGLYFSRKLNPIVKSVLVFMCVVLVLGVIFSYTRAAWVSLIGAFGLFMVLLLRVRLSTLLLGAALGGFLFFSFYDQIMMNLARNKTDSSDNLADHATSISNISSDASNLERINRWNCAIRLWQERPIFGWGPGTYQFYYASFQHSSELTIISTNFGDLGNAHSEYLGPLSEQGLPGMLIMVILVIMIFYSGVRLYLDMPPGEWRLMVLVLLLGLVTYFIHGVLNNYLDTDKASIPFWGFTAVIVVADVLFRRGELPADS
jgi:putative inorganic carbon (hco3(-)) transporter